MKKKKKGTITNNKIKFKCKWFKRYPRKREIRGIFKTIKIKYIIRGYGCYFIIYDRNKKKINNWQNLKKI